MPQGSPSGLQQIQRMQGMQWGDGRTDYHLWLDGDRLYTDAKFSGIASSIVAGSAVAASNVIGIVTIPANTLNVNGKALRIRAWGQFAGNNNAKGAQLITTAVFEVLAQTGRPTTASNGGGWLIDVTIQRRNPTEVTYVGLASYSDSTITSGTVTKSNVLVFDTSINQTIQVAAIPPLIADNDVTFLGMIVEVVN